MSSHDNCEICGETYDSDNLITCNRCRRDFCYRCGESREALCERCREKESAAAAKQ